MKPAIRVDNLSKSYRLGARADARYPTLREKIADSVTGAWHGLRHRLNGAGNGRGKNATKDDSFWALKDVSFEVQPGEVVGIVGRNGAGKSTLLKILSRIVDPTQGRCEFRGRMASLLEVGTGFHPELTGRENIYLNGSLLGMSRKEIERYFDDIVAFSEIEQFLDTPVKRYSSGMYVRLAFAVAAYLEPDILIVDEVLAVGDQAFQRKCTQRMQDVSGRGHTILFVSHNMPAVQKLCRRCVYLESGKVVNIGETSDILNEYTRATMFSDQSSDIDLSRHQGRMRDSIPTMTHIRVCDDSQPEHDYVAMKGTVRLAVAFDSQRTLNDVTFGVVVKDSFQTPVFGINNLVLPGGELNRAIKKGYIICRIRDIPLMPGRYPIDLYLGSHGQNFDVVYNAVEMNIVETDVFKTGRLPPKHCGSICWPAEWEIQRDE